MYKSYSEEMTNRESQEDRFLVVMRNADRSVVRFD